ncbi:MAG: purine-nucleoside phosphorylase [Planctomycetota bacterium]
MAGSSEIFDQVVEASEWLRARFAGRRPQVGLILGSGYSAEDLGLRDVVSLESGEVPHLPRPRVQGHGAKWVMGRLGEIVVLVAGGRSHRYEGVELARATMGVRVMAALGCEALVVTNAAGGVCPAYRVGTCMALRDHINLLGDSPLVGVSDPRLGPRFVDMTVAYDSDWRRRVITALAVRGVAIEEGVYAACLGPQYETPAEVRMLAHLGADAVGMSTVPEVIVARQVGLRVFGLSLITNPAAGVTEQLLAHDEVLAAGKAARPVVSQVLQEAILRFRS